MPVGLASWIAGALELYVALGALFALAFHRFGLRRLDPAAAASSLGFRIVVTPGIVALWPLLAARWAGGATGPPEERNPHRARAHAAGATRP